MSGPKEKAIAEVTDAPEAKRIKRAAPLELFAAALQPAVESFFSAAAEGDGSLAELLSEQVVWHDSLLPPEGPDLVGHPQLQALRALLLRALPDLSLRVQAPGLLAGEQGLLLGYWSATGTHTGDLGPSLPPSGAQATFEGSIVVRTSARGAPAAGVAERAGEGAADGDRGVQQPRGEPGKAQQVAEAEAEAQEAVSGGPGVVGVEVWWSWDPIFLFRQLGWQAGGKEAGGKQAEEGAAGSSGDAAGASAAGPEMLPAESAAAAAAAANGAQGVANDLAAQTAAAARAAYATEAAAVEAAAAAVAAAAEAEARVAEGADGALAEAQAANRGVVELYFHTYNTGHFGVLDHIVHPGYKYDGLLTLGSAVGREAMVAMMSGWRLPLADLAIGHEFFAAVGADRVSFRWVIRGTHTAAHPLLGVPTTGRPLYVKGVTTLTLQGGRIVRKISHANAARTLQQLGAAEHPAIPLP